MKKSKKSKIIIIVLITLIVLTLILGVGYFLYRNNIIFNSSTKVSEKKKDNKDKTNPTTDIPKETNDSTTKPSQNNNDLFGAYYDKALEKMNSMTLEEKVGQVLLTRSDYKTNDYEIVNYHPAGYIFFAQDFENQNKGSFLNKVNAYQSESKIPMIMSVDEEGGIVNRISKYRNFRASPFRSPQVLYNAGGMDLILKIENEKDALLKSLGLNLVLAPVADTSTDPNNYIYSRSFGKSGSETATYIKNVVTRQKVNGLSGCLKHFPGYGNNVDTHTGIAIDDRSLDSFRSNDFLPFEAGIEAKVPTILVSHNVVKAIDENLPSSLSSKVHQILREDMKYTGIIMTDDLAMDAVKSYVQDKKAATLALNAGNDLIITSDLGGMYKELLNSLNDGSVSPDTLNTAVKRVLAWKYAYGILN